MEDGESFDPTFDFKTEVRPGEDPDRRSPTLRRFHKLLWSKPLPSGDPFDLDDATPPYLHHSSPRGEFYLTSDSAIPTWTRWARMTKVLASIPESERERFRTVAGQMGGRIVFPGRRINGRTINEARGIDARIADRLDLTLECIRLHYLGETSPLAPTLLRYAEFFELFQDFRGYVDFFLLQDLVSDDASSVEFLLPFTGFGASGLPVTPEAYQGYRLKATAFVEARNRRMIDYVSSR
jgi:hypothetical protein